MDEEYWNNFYAKHGLDATISNESSFANFCQNHFFKDTTFNIIELGSGNGRDAIFFSKYSHKVVALDKSNIAINIEEKNLRTDKTNILLKNTDFILEDYSKYKQIDIFYSRFTLHSISEKDENIIISKVYNNLKEGGLFCIEARTIKDPLYGEGKNIGMHEFKTDHYRRFIDSNVFLKKVLNIGFKLQYFIEKNNLSIYKDDNPVLMRIILEK